LRFAVLRERKMRKFSSDQIIFALLVGAIIVGITIYRYFFMF
jgi:hypothetical protein